MRTTTKSTVKPYLPQDRDNYHAGPTIKMYFNCLESIGAYVPEYFSLELASQWPKSTILLKIPSELEERARWGLLGKHTSSPAKGVTIDTTLEYL